MNNPFKVTPLQVTAAVLSVIGFFVAKELRREELETAVDKKLAEREKARSSEQISE